MEEGIHFYWLRHGSKYSLQGSHLEFGWLSLHYYCIMLLWEALSAGKSKKISGGKKMHWGVSDNQDSTRLESHPAAWERSDPGAGQPLSAQPLGSMQVLALSQTPGKNSSCQGGSSMSGGHRFPRGFPAKRKVEEGRCCFESTLPTASPAVQGYRLPYTLK